MLQELESDSRDARPAYAENVSGRGREVDDAAPSERTAVDDDYGYVAAVVEVMDPHMGSERKLGVRGDQAAVSWIMIIRRNPELIRRGV